MSDADSDEEPHRMGLARLAMARSLSCDLISKGGSDGGVSSQCHQKEDYFRDDLVSYSSSSSGFASQNSESQNKNKLSDKVSIIETYSIDKNGSQVMSNEAAQLSSTDIQDGFPKGKALPYANSSGGGAASKLSFLQSLHQKSFKRKPKVTDDADSCHISLSSFPVGSSQNLLKIPARSRSKSLTRLSNAFSNVHKLGISPVQASQKPIGESTQAVDQSQAAAAICALVSSNSSFNSNGSKDLHETRKVPSASQTPICPVCPHSHGDVDLPCMSNKASPFRSLCSCPSPNSPLHLSRQALPEHRRASCVDTNSTSSKCGSNSSCLNLSRNKVHPEKEFSRNTNIVCGEMPDNSHKRHRKKYKAKCKHYARLPDDLPSMADSKKEILTRPLSPWGSESDLLNRPSSWYGFNKIDIFSTGSTDSCSSNEEMNLKRNTKLLRQRSFSLCRLDDGGGRPPLAAVSSTTSKQRNYLIGGPDNLLGNTELQRYFPDRKVTIFLATWNMNSNPPPMELEDFLLPDDMDIIPDIYVIGTQESDDDKTEWQVRLQATIGPSHVLLTSSSLGILHLCVFLRRDLIWFCSVPEDDSHSLRPGTYFKTKGAVAISLQFFGSRLLFINTHLFAHEEKLAQRIQNYKNVIRNLDLPKNLHVNRSTSKKDLTHRYDVIFWLGDLNFRIVGDREAILDKIESSKKKRDYFDLLYFDQLKQARKKGEIFNGFDEAPIHFAPTFKFDVGTDNYDSSSKQRVPAYTDRILFKSTRDPINCLRYDSFPLLQTSDHKPVWGMYTFKIRPGKDDVPLAAGLFQRDIYLEGIKRRRRFFNQSSHNCQIQ